jgi:ADP-ribose pyrophosphatase
MSPPEPEPKSPAADPVASLISTQPYDRGAFRQIGERSRYNGERLNVVGGTFVGPNGFTFEREIVRTFDAVCVVPLEDDGEHVLLVRQYRGPVDQGMLEIPAGKMDVPGEPPELCAARELNEEVGAEAERFVELGRFYNSPGFCDEGTTCFLAQGLRVGKRAADGIEEENLAVEAISLAALDELIAKGEIVDAKTIIGLQLTRSYLNAAPPGVPGG